MANEELVDMTNSVDEVKKKIGNEENKQLHSDLEKLNKLYLNVLQWEQARRKIQTDYMSKNKKERRVNDNGKHQNTN